MQMSKHCVGHDPSLSLCNCCSAIVSGGQGFKSGAMLGRRLVEKQSKVLVQLLAALADLLGTPATEVLWLQVRFTANV